MSLMDRGSSHALRGLGAKAAVLGSSMACVLYTPKDAGKFLSSRSFRGLKNCPDYNYIPG